MFLSFDPEAVDAQMLSTCFATSTEEDAVSSAIRHHLSAGGSRIRARFCLEASQNLGIEPGDALTLAVICELLHNASLLHDDLLDKAPVRRGLPSVWARFGDTIAVCAGDLLLASAFAAVGKLHRPDMYACILCAVHRSTRDVILGQGNEKASSPQKMLEYEQLAAGKSASLLSLPVELALLYSGNAEYTVKANCVMRAFAVGYQMLDDLADYDEDLRNGSLNAISVAFVPGSTDYSTAASFVGARALELLRDAVAGASQLPMGCASTIAAEGEKMLSTLCALQDSTVDPKEPDSGTNRQSWPAISARITVQQNEFGASATHTL